ncbi:hypothetical protein K458DRAFT_415276 [Lentithecium fluviatile CBS 122367]|uniref:Mid2 domain-containing protein n=1 Tax=Lentithecium fluviatile CBS 122367 TaxID=1168545 RepID=A0A6G1JCU1_9PLEO|nr:hypothetical protein K458DRAFT_415276 [Lentithecium fluviatile CBS 122367]
MPSTLRLPTVLTLALTLLTPLASTACYDPDGNLEKNSEYIPCSNNATDPLHTICCATNRSVDRGPDICVPNGLCQVGLKKGETAKAVPAYTKPQCTKSEYGEVGCLHVCGNNNLEFLTPCDTSAGGNKSRTWCCGFENTDCCSRSDAEIIFLDFADALATESSSTSSRASSTPTASPSTSTPASTPTSASSTPTPTTPTIPSTSPSPSTASSTSLTTGAKAGIGIGASVGALVLIGLGIWLGKYLSARRSANASVAPNRYDTGMYDAGGYQRGAVTYTQHGEAVHKAWESGRRTPTAELADEKPRGEMAQEKDPMELA